MIIIYNCLKIIYFKLIFILKREKTISFKNYKKLIHIFLLKKFNERK